MRIAITGSSGLAKTIKDVIEASPHAGQTFTVTPIRCEDITSNGTNCWIFNGHTPCDVLLNFAHQDQTKILSIAHEAWKDEGSKLIINFSSRASQPNISKGYVYASEKAQLNHLANNLTYNSKKKYKMTTKSGKSVCLQAVTMIDPATGWIEICIVPSAWADLVANQVELAWLTHYPSPNKVIMDRGNDF